MTPRKPWTCADTAMLRKLAARGLPMHHIGERMGRSASSVKRWAKLEGIHVSQPAPRSTWAPPDDAVLRDLWPHHTAVEIGRRMVRSAQSVNYRGHKLGLRKPEGYQKKHTTWRWQTGQCEASKPSQFSAGNTPWNKGKRGSTGYQPSSAAETASRLRSAGAQS